jgi:ABC-type phosphate/phosphonate transport system substrate-binding protein
MAVLPERASELKVGAAKQASMPLYGLSELRAAKADFWRALCVEFSRAGGTQAPDVLDFAQSTVPACIEARVLFTQVCGYPLQKLFASQAVLLGAPLYQADFCEAATHCGVFVVHRAARYEGLEDLRDCRFVFGGPFSNSGMNLPRRAIAEIAGGSPFFAHAMGTDSQAGNLELVAQSEVDATCVDNVTFAYVVKHRPSVAARLRVLAPTPRSPTIPFVTSTATPPATVERLRRALAEVGAAPEWADARAGLMLRGIVPAEPADYECLLEYEQQAVTLGYPQLC